MTRSEKELQEAAEQHRKEMHEECDARLAKLAEECRRQEESGK